MRGPDLETDQRAVPTAYAKRKHPGFVSFTPSRKGEIRVVEEDGTVSKVVPATRKERRSLAAKMRRAGQPTNKAQPDPEIVPIGDKLITGDEP